eukprot:SAG11_NODE_19413_length_467_cov_0.836957_2_plen_30_part_01
MCMHGALVAHAQRSSNGQPMGGESQRTGLP